MHIAPVWYGSGEYKRENAGGQYRLGQCSVELECWRLVSPCWVREAVGNRYQAGIRPKTRPSHIYSPAWERTALAYKFNVHARDSTTKPSFPSVRFYSTVVFLEDLA